MAVGKQAQLQAEGRTSAAAAAVVEKVVAVVAAVAVVAVEVSWRHWTTEVPYTSTSRSREGILSVSNSAMKRKRLDSFSILITLGLFDYK